MILYPCRAVPSFIISLNLGHREQIEANLLPSGYLSALLVMFAKISVGCDAVSALGFFSDICSIFLWTTMSHCLMNQFTKLARFLVAP